MLAVQRRLETVTRVLNDEPGGGRVILSSEEAAPADTKDEPDTGFATMSIEY